MTSKVEEDKVADAKWQGSEITGKLDTGESFECTFIDYTNPNASAFIASLNKHKVDTKFLGPGPGSTISGVAAVILPTLIFVAVIYFFISRMAQASGSQAMNFGKSKARRVGESGPKVTFDDVAGIDEAKQELFEVVDFLKNTKKYAALGAKIPKGILLTGPPGVGKTHLARAIAGEAGVPFFHISGSDFVEMFVGVGAARVRDLFETAKAHRPSLIFVDEIDAVGRQRGAGLGGGHDEREQTLNQLLVEMDGFDPNSGVIMIAATNRPDVLDPALLRPGRFDRQIVVDAPDQKGRLAILNIHSKGKPLDSEVNLEVLSKRTPGFTGADLANMLNEGALLSARRNRTKIGMLDLEEALDRVIAGPQRKSRVMDDEERKVIAYHEAGHALIGELLERGATVTTYDPVAMDEARRIFGDDPRIRYADNPMHAIEGAVALVIVTEWKEFRSPDFERLKEQLATPSIFDGRNLYDPQMVRAMGFDYYPMGRPELRRGTPAPATVHSH